jgi:hypothetical protein
MYAHKEVCTYSFIKLELYFTCSPMVCFHQLYVIVGRDDSLWVSCAPTCLAGCAKNTRPFLRVISATSDLELHSIHCVCECVCVNMFN